MTAATSLTVNPILLATIAISASGVLVLTRRAPSQAHSRVRLLSLAGGVSLLLTAWVSPVASVSEHYLLSAHLLQITLTMGVVPPLLLLALPRYPSLRVPRRVALCLRALVHPVPAVLAVNAAFFCWHLSGPYDVAASGWGLYGVEQLTLFLTSLAFWWPIVSPLSPPARSMTPLGKLGYILLATIPQTFGGLLVALSHHPLYAVYASAPRLLGFSVMTDQQLAGACMALLSKVSLLAAFFVIFMRALQTGSPDVDDGDGGGGGRGPDRGAPRPVPPGTPHWLSDVEAGRTVPEPAPAIPSKVPATSGSVRA